MVIRERLCLHQRWFGSGDLGPLAPLTLVTFLTVEGNHLAGTGAHRTSIQTSIYMCVCVWREEEEEEDAVRRDAFGCTCE